MDFQILIVYYVLFLLYGYDYIQILEDKKKLKIVKSIKS